MTKAEHPLLGTDLCFYSDSHPQAAEGDTAKRRAAPCTAPNVIPAGSSYQAMCLLLSEASATQSHEQPPALGREVPRSPHYGP